jgi:hypothetical protein
MFAKYFEEYRKYENIIKVILLSFSWERTYELKPEE